MPQTLPYSGYRARGVCALQSSSIYILQSGRRLIREIKVPMQELELKLQGGLCVRGVYLRDSTVSGKSHERFNTCT